MQLKEISCLSKISGYRNRSGSICDVASFVEAAQFSSFSASRKKFYLKKGNKSFVPGMQSIFFWVSSITIPIFLPAHFLITICIDGIKNIFFHASLRVIVNFTLSDTRSSDVFVNFNKTSIGLIWKKNFPHFFFQKSIVF